MIYELSFKGEAGELLAGAFDGLTLYRHAGISTVRGEFADQAAVHGLLARVNALGLELLGMRQIVDIDAADLPDAAPRRPAPGRPSPPPG